jgi:hypothetical protein
MNIDLQKNLEISKISMKINEYERERENLKPQKTPKLSVNINEYRNQFQTKSMEFDEIQ